MAKKKKISRKELLSQQDEFLTYSAKLLQYANQYKKQLAIALGGLFAVGIAVSGFQYFSAQNEKKAFALLAQHKGRYETAASEKSGEEAYRAVEKDFKAILEDYSGTRAADIAGIMLANICYQGGDFDAAIALYRANMKAFEADPAIQSLMLSNLGYCQEAKKEYEAAAAYFEQIVQGPRFIMKDEALFSLARIYDQIGNKEKRLAVLNQLVSEYKDSLYSDLARESISG